MKPIWKKLLLSQRFVISRKASSLYGKSPTMFPIGYSTSRYFLRIQMHHALLCNPWQGRRLYITLFKWSETHRFKELPQFCLYHCLWRSMVKETLIASNPMPVATIMLLFYISDNYCSVLCINYGSRLALWLPFTFLQCTTTLFFNICIHFIEINELVFIDFNEMNTNIEK